MNTQPEIDTFWGRCSQADNERDTRFERPNWRDDGTCSHCGGLKPSIALELIRAGSEATPTDKNYKIYVEGASNPGGKCYLNHFSEVQAVEFVRLYSSGQMKIAFPGHFYRGLCFGRYKEALLKEHE